MYFIKCAWVFLLFTPTLTMPKCNRQKYLWGKNHLIFSLLKAMFFLNITTDNFQEINAYRNIRAWLAKKLIFCNCMKKIVTHLKLHYHDAVYLPLGVKKNVFFSGSL